MLGIVEGNYGKENAGKWDVAAVPGGGGNWGGSWSRPARASTEGGRALPTSDQRPEPDQAFKAKGPIPTKRRRRVAGFHRLHEPLLQQRPPAKISVSDPEDPADPPRPSTGR